MAKLGPEQLTTVRIKDGESIPALLHTQIKTTKEALSPLPPIAMALGNGGAGVSRQCRTGTVTEP